MTKQELLEQLQDNEWDNFEVKAASTELPKSSWETMFYLKRIRWVIINNEKIY